MFNGVYKKWKAKLIAFHDNIFFLIWLYYPNQLLIFTDRVYRFFTCFAISLVGSTASIFSAHTFAAALFCFTLYS